MQPVKGTQDHYPYDKDFMNQIARRFTEVAKRYSYLEIEMPALESLELLSRKEGEEIQEQIFVLEQRGKEKLGLRFDLTVPATRMFIQKQKGIAKPIKWFYNSRMWRYEAPQKGRLREFYQFGVECFGTDNIEADAEVIRLAIECMESLELAAKDIVVLINNRDLLEGLLDSLGIKDIDDVVTIIDKREKLPADEFEKELTKVGVTDGQLPKLLELLDSSLEDLPEPNDKAKAGKETLTTLFTILDDKKDFLRFDLSTARGLAYYTGTVFEIFDRDMEFRALCGGGRYDRLVETLGGEPCPATGFAIGYATLRLLLEEKVLMPMPRLGPDYYVVIVNDTVRDKAREIAISLREKDYNVEMDLTGRNLGNQFKHAAARDAKETIIVGPKDLEQECVTIRDMVSGKESKVPLKQLL